MSRHFRDLYGLLCTRLHKLPEEVGRSSYRRAVRLIEYWAGERGAPSGGGTGALSDVRELVERSG
jgi:hypothetical protein